MPKFIISFPVLCLAYLLLACNPSTEIVVPEAAAVNTEADKALIATLLDSFNAAAARADFETYFSYYTEDAIFMGTDATEHWDKQAFMKWAKPAFDSKKTWNFSALERHIYTGEQPGIAWFDELLDTQMKICRGSGVVVKKDGTWKVQQYVLSMTIPNSQIDPVLKIKGPEEDSIISVLKGI
jgi:ketosteroid isomerase-like protein